MLLITSRGSDTQEAATQLEAGVTFPKPDQGEVLASWQASLQSEYKLKLRTI